MMKRWIKRDDDKNTLRQYLITYFIVLFIPLLICCSYYGRMIAVISEDDIQTRKTGLEHSAVQIDALMEELSYLADTLAGMPDVNLFRFRKETLQYPDTYRVIELQKKLLNVEKLNRSVFSYFIFFDKSELVLNDHIAYTYQDFYDLYLHREADTAYEEWQAYLKKWEMNRGIKAAEKYQYLKKESRELVSYSVPLPANGDNSSNGVVRLFLENAVLQNLMPSMGEEDIQYILDPTGSLIYYNAGSAVLENTEKPEEMVQKAGQAVSGEEGSFLVRQGKIRINGVKYLTLQYPSASEYTYGIFLPENMVNQRKFSSMLMLTRCILLASIVGILLSYHMSLKTATPLNELLKEASRIAERTEGHQSVFDGLKDAMQYLSGVNSELAAMMEKQKPYIRNAFVNRLLFGNPGMREETNRIAGYMGIKYENQSFCVLVFRMAMGENRDEKALALMNACLLSLMEVMEEKMPGSLYANTGEDQVVLILETARSDRERIRELAEEKLRRIREELPGTIAEKMFVYGGNVVDRLEDIFDSYHNAAFMFRNESRQIENQIIWYQKNAGNTLELPAFDLSVKLTRLVTAGDEQGLHDALKEIMVIYIMENNLPSWLQQMLLNELQAVLFRILAQMDIEEGQFKKYYDELEKNHCNPLITQITNTLNLYRSLCAFVNEQKNSGEAENLMPAIAAYIDANYGDCCLSLTKTADTFQISEPYLSSLFKQSMGINFSNYVEGIRIDKAKELLKSTSESVGVIAEMTGYNSANSFCRAFKRVTGISASEYRRSI